MGLLKDKRTRALLFIMGALVAVCIFIARVHYNGINKTIDPRMVDARKLYNRYDGYAQSNQFDSVLWLMDTLESIYISHEHYKNSYEIGVLLNNRAAAYLTQALYRSGGDSTAMDSLVQIAGFWTDKAINLYRGWNGRFKSKSEPEIQEQIKTDFFIGLEEIPEAERQLYIEKRSSEILEAQIETDRRLSVSYTNKGVIHRYRKQYTEAAKCYETALQLWGRNLSAENNLNILLGKPLKKQNVVQKLFPPDRD